MFVCLFLDELHAIYQNYLKHYLFVRAIFYLYIIHMWSVNTKFNKSAINQLTFVFLLLVCNEGLLHFGDMNTVLSIHAIAFLINVFSTSLRVEKLWTEMVQVDG